ncbi:MAG: MFS transporter [Thermomicrobiales bacterium]
MGESAEQIAAPATTGITAQERRTFIVAGLVVALTQLGFFITSAALPLYLRDLGAAEGRIGLEVGAGNLAAVFVTFMLGPALNRFGPRPFITMGAALYFIAALAMLAVPAEGPVTFLRILQGAGAAVVTPSASTLVTGLFPTRPATALGLLSSLNSLALAGGPPLGLVLYTVHGASGLFLPAALVAAFGLAATRLLPGARPVHRASGYGFDRAWFPLLITIALSMIHFGGILAYLSLHLRAVHGPNAGIFFAADSLGVLLLRAPTGFLVDRVGSRWPKILGVLLIFLGVIFLGLSPSPLTLIAAGAGTGIGSGMLVSGIFADLARLSAAANRGTALSLGTACFSGGFFVGSTISGLLIGPGGFGAVVLFSAAATLSALPFALGRQPAPRTA